MEGKRGGRCGNIRLLILKETKYCSEDEINNVDIVNEFFLPNEILAVAKQIAKLCFEWYDDSVGLHNNIYPV